jgi:hypothetical protein
MGLLPIRLRAGAAFHPIFRPLGRSCREWAVRSLPPGSPHKRGNGPPPLAGAFASGASFFLPISPGRRAKPVPQGRPRRGPGDPPGLGLIGFDGACGPVGQASRFGDKGAQQPQARMTGAGSMALPVAILPRAHKGAARSGHKRQSGICCHHLG